MLWNFLQSFFAADGSDRIENWITYSASSKIASTGPQGAYTNCVAVFDYQGHRHRATIFCKISLRMSKCRPEIPQLPKDWKSLNNYSIHLTLSLFFCRFPWLFERLDLSYLFYIPSFKTKIKLFVSWNVEYCCSFGPANRQFLAISRVLFSRWLHTCSTVSTICSAEPFKLLKSAYFSQFKTTTVLNISGIKHFDMSSIVNIRTTIYSMIIWTSLIST